LVRNQDGVWSVTVGPVVPGFHYYWYVVDGIEVSDPSSESYFGHNKELSGVEVPEKGTDFYDVKDVPHGDVRIHWYHSKTTGSWRRAYVYTPPDYDRNVSARYPVLYLQHGANENGSSWSRQGRAGPILDNLIAAGKAQAMIVVMETGYASQPAAPFGPAPAIAAAGSNPSAFERIVIDDLIPMIDGAYRTLADRDHRAMAGLSMGGAQTLQITLSHLDKFSWIGCFSAPIRGFDVRTAYNGAFADPAAFNRKVHLLWIGAGTAETAMHDDAKAMHEALDKAGIGNVFYESQGTAHEFQTWRRDLADFAPRLFRDTAPAAELWKFDRIDQIGGHKTTLLGHPRVIDSPVGKAVEFNGVDDALFVDVHPLAGAETFTWEIVFRPDPGGAPAQHYDGHELRNYVDGELEGSGELRLIPQGPGHSSIGVRISRVNYFKGAVAMARMTPAALPPAELLTLPGRPSPGAPR
jgi:enterochelin esterase family protein